MNQNDEWKPLRQAGQLSTLGIAMALSIVIGIAVGWYLDKWLGTKPWMFLLFMVFGIVAGFSIVIKEISKLGREDSRENSNGDNKPATGN